jgi:hypothetical protein
LHGVIDGSGRVLRCRLTPSKTAARQLLLLLLLLLEFARANSNLLHLGPMLRNRVEEPHVGAQRDAIKATVDDEPAEVNHPDVTVARRWWGR